MNSLSGTQLGQYRLVHPVGKGGMAVVYKARQLNMNRDVAVKILSPDLAADPEFIARFEREVEIIAKLQHPHILPVYDFGREDGTIYLVMRLMEGGSLAQELREKSPLPIERVIELTRQIGSALDYAHRRGVVHRDLKPTNILLDDLGNAYLTDFGIAKMIAGGPTTGLTQSGAVMGTPTYMAPEQWRSQPVDGRTDIYALGVIVYQMLLGQVPFAAETPHGLMYQHLDMQPPAPHTINPKIPLAVEPVLTKALAKQRDDRYASAGEFAAELEKALKAPPDRLPEQAALEAAGDAGMTQPANAPDLAGPADEQLAPPPLVEPPPLRSARPTTPPPLYTAPPPPQPTYPPPLHQPAYVPPVYRPRRFPVREANGQRALGRWLLVLAGVAVAVVVLGAVAVVGLDLFASGETGGASTEEAATPVPTPTVDPALRPRVTVQSPADNSTVNLGDPVTIEFTAEGLRGITHVELRRYDFALDSRSFSGETRVMGTFTYTPDTSGQHTLELVAWSGDVQGVATTLNLFAQ